MAAFNVDDVNVPFPSGNLPSSVGSLLYSMISGTATQSTESQGSSTAEIQDENRIPPSNAPWGQGETKLLLNSYFQYSRQVGPMKRFRSKRAMYEQIAKDIFEVLQITRTGVQCETRFKTLAKRKRSEDNHNRTSGNSRCQTSYEEEFNAIRAIDDSLEPEVLRSVGQVTYKDSTLDRSTAGPSSAAQDGNIDNSEGSEQDDASTRAPGGESRCKKRKADRGIQPSNGRMQHMVLFFEQMKALNDAKERKKEEREKRKEERHQELLQAHKAQMQTLRDLANKQ